MWPFHRKRFDVERLTKCLSDTKVLIDQCDHGYSFGGLSDAEISMDLAINIEALAKNGDYDKAHLQELFALAGPIQNISIGEGWGEQFLLLAEEFDAADRTTI